MTSFLAFLVKYVRSFKMKPLPLWSDFYCCDNTMKKVLPSTSHLFLVCCGAWATGCDVVQHQKKLLPGLKSYCDPIHYAMKWNFRLTCFFISLSAASSVSTLIPTSTPLIQFAKQKFLVWIGFPSELDFHIITRLMSPFSLSIYRKVIAFLSPKAVCDTIHQSHICTRRFFSREATLKFDLLQLDSNLDGEIRFGLRLTRLV